MDAARFASFWRELRQVRSVPLSVSVCVCVCVPS